MDNYLATLAFSNHTLPTVWQASIQCCRPRQSVARSFRHEINKQLMLITYRRRCSCVNCKYRTYRMSRSISTPRCYCRSWSLPLDPPAPTETTCMKMRSQRKRHTERERPKERERDLHTLSVAELLLAFVLARAHRFLPFTVAAHSYLDFQIERTSLGSFAALRVCLSPCVCVFISLRCY